MNILFGIQGTGNGHISRARIMAEELTKHQDINVQYLFTGRPKEQLFDMEAFGDYWYRQGLTFVTENGKVSHVKTLMGNNIVKFISDTISLKLSTFDLIITDFEPVVAWAGKLKGIPVLGLGHQYAFGQNTPICHDSVLTRAIMKYFAPAKNSLGLHWHKYDSNVLPPIIDTKLQANVTEAKIIVYLPFEDQTMITQLLLEFPQIQFVQYASNLSNKELKNVSLRKASLAFKEDLRSSTGVICNSGFELISECLHLGIPILTKPLNGQMEQHSNALALSQLNYATVIEHLNVENIATWIDNKKTPKAKPIPNVAKVISELIINNNGYSADSVSDNLWDQFNAYSHS